jgi:hypothetical protein
MVGMPHNWGALLEYERKEEQTVYFLTKEIIHILGFLFLWLFIMAKI